MSGDFGQGGPLQMVGSDEGNGLFDAGIVEGGLNGVFHKTGGRKVYNAKVGLDQPRSYLVLAQLDRTVPVAVAVPEIHGH